MYIMYMCSNYKYIHVHHVHVYSNYMYLLELLHPMRSGGGGVKPADGDGGIRRLCVCV